jgi:hypothetical protein
MTKSSTNKAFINVNIVEACGDATLEESVHAVLWSL